jgi:glycerate 2-kinase
MSVIHPRPIGTVAVMRVLAAFDKFRGTLTAPEATGAAAAACWELGFDCDEAPLSDGGEGLLDVFGGSNRVSVVTGPLGAPVEAGWRLDRRTAVVEMARASGLLLAGGPAANDPLTATTRGTGELIAKAIEQGARTVLVGLGGSATTDGGLGAIEALGSPARLRPIDLQVACDVHTRFVDAASVFAPQKGATPAQVRLLRARLEGLVVRYVSDYDVDVSGVDGTGAAGGLAGGLLAMGARLVPGFDLVAEHVDLDERLAAADVVVTGEGYLDAQSLDGKVVGGVCALAVAAGIPALVIVGNFDPAARDSVRQAGFAAVSLVEVFGEQRAFREPRWCLEQAMREELAKLR